jgi:signal transduction histidine kinase
VTSASLSAAASPSQSPGEASAGLSPARRDGESSGRTRSAGKPEHKASRYALKNWRVRSRLLLLVVLPTLSAVILGGVAVAASIRSAAAYQRVEQFSRLGGEITGLVQALQTEREDTIRFITMGAAGGGRGAPPGEPGPELAVLAQDDHATGVLAAGVRSLAGHIGGAYPAVAQQEAHGAITAIAGIPALRSAATTTRIPSLAVIQQYADAIDQLLALEDEIATGGNDAALADTVRVVGLISGMKEEASREQAILTSALTPDLVGANQFQPGQLSALNAAQAEQQADVAQFDLAATSSQRRLYDATLSSAQADRAQAQIQQAITLALGGGSSAENPAFTNAASGSAYLVSSLHAVEQGLMSSIIGQSASQRGKAIRSALLDSAAVMLVLALALFFTIAVGRSMTRPLRRLRAGALEIAGTRLPETVRKMSESAGTDAPLEVEPIDVDSSDEIGEVARAFDQVHREAVRLAANEAALRGNVNAMFVNLSRRSQSLVERQIRLIDDLEQGEQDSERLANLFQMDHLATRMRRNCENLLVLAGHELSRQRTEPVPLVDVLRAAVSEIEQYERVVPNIQPGISVRGQAVTDVVHLLSELAENATTLSAADTPVNVSGHLLNSGGALLDITDQGVGMDAEEMAHANWRLDNPPMVDVAVSRRMGLFVVARLAARHGIRVRLRPSSFGGLTALVWLPNEVILRESPSPAFRRFQPPAAGAAGPDTPGGPAGKEAGGYSAAAQAVAAARVARFGPARPDAGEADTDPGAVLEGSELAAAPTADAIAPVPLAGDAQAFGSDGAGPPATGMPNGNGAQSGDGMPPSSGVPHSNGAPGNGTEPGNATAPGASDAPGVIVPPAPDIGDENRLPIFESVESDWFRRGRLGADCPAPVSSQAPSPAGWSSPADEGWQAAGVARAPVSSGTTRAGLPKRVPMANLVPGSAGASAAPAPPRSAAQTRERMASFQQGIRNARAATPSDADYPGAGNGTEENQ